MTLDPNAERRSPMAIAIRWILGSAAMLVCLAFCALWVASLRYSLGAGTNYVDIGAMSFKGKVLIQFNPAGVNFFDDWYLVKSEMDAPGDEYWRQRPPFSVGLDHNKFVEIHFQHWFVIALSIIAAYSAFSFSWRFNIRTLLFAIAVASALLSGIVVANSLPR